jgi:dihydroorotate dehydrogenase electron transfer subunit
LRISESKMKNQSDWRVDRPVSVRISRIVDEAKDIKSFYFEYEMDAKPGQFFLIWLPGVDEKPFGISYQEKGMFGAIICKVGKFTEDLFRKKPGDMVGIRGPYGTSFTIKGKEIALVAGGYGIAPLSFLADEAMKKGINVHFISGAKTKESLVFCRKNERSCKYMYSTDDGTYGEKGFSTHVLEKLLAEHHIDRVYAVGPERMMHKVVELTDKYSIPCEISLERYMKCGIGICGQCCVDDLGIRMCQEGPVIDKALAKKIIEFGKYKRDATGKKVDI